MGWYPGLLLLEVELGYSGGMTGGILDEIAVGLVYHVETILGAEFQNVEVAVVMTEVELPEMTTGQMVVPTGITDVIVFVEVAGQSMTSAAQLVTVCV